MSTIGSSKWAAPAAVVAAAVAVVSVGCTRPAATGIRGRVAQAPCGRPVEEGKPVCQDLPVDAAIVVSDENCTVVGRTHTDARGLYRVRLNEVSGAYTVTVDLGDPPPLWPQCPVGQVVVIPGHTAVADILCGSGMR